MSLGLARTGTVAHNGSGDIFLAFSTANEAAFATTAGGPRGLEWDAGSRWSVSWTSPFAGSASVYRSVTTKPPLTLVE